MGKKEKENFHKFVRQGTPADIPNGKSNEEIIDFFDKADEEIKKGTGKSIYSNDFDKIRTKPKKTKFYEIDR